MCYTTYRLGGRTFTGNMRNDRVKGAKMVKYYVYFVNNEGVLYDTNIYGLTWRKALSLYNYYQQKDYPGRFIICL